MPTINLNNLFAYKLESAKRMLDQGLVSRVESHQHTGSIWVFDADGTKDLFWCFDMEIEGAPLSREGAY